MPPHPGDDLIARSFRALSHPRRAAIFRILTENPRNGHSYTTLQTAVRLPSTSLVHHLREMERCGLIKRFRKGADVRYLIIASDLNAALTGASQALQRLGASLRPAT